MKKIILSRTYNRKLDRQVFETFYYKQEKTRSYNKHDNDEDTNANFTRLN